MPYWRCLEFGITQLRNIHYIFGLGIYLPIRSISSQICSVTGFTLLSFICYLMIQNCFIGDAGGGRFAKCLLCYGHGHFSYNCPQNGHGIDPKVFFFLSIILILKNCHIGFYFFLEPLYMYWYFWFVILAFSQLC